MSDIPSEICREIFLRLPAKSLIRFRSVCKPWRHVIDDPIFIKAHTNKQLSSNTILIRNSSGPPLHPFYYFDLETVNFDTNGLHTIIAAPLEHAHIVLPRLPFLPEASCNGLMLIPPERTWRLQRNWHPKANLEIWNPLTNECLKVPQLTIDSDVNSDLEVVSYGLGYDCAAHDYKIVVINCRQSGGSYRDVVRRTHVYSVKSDSWRNIGECMFGIRTEFPERAGKPGVFVNGSLHWTGEDEIIAFDVGTEEFRHLSPLPFIYDVESTTGYHHVRLDALSGCLVVSFYNIEDMKFDMWAMNDYGSLDSWVKLLSLDGDDVHFITESMRPVAYMKNKKQVLLQHLDGLVWIDVESGAMKAGSIHCVSENFSLQQTCPGSLFRLHDSCGRVASETRKPKRKRKRNMNMAHTKLSLCVRDYDHNDYTSYSKWSHDSCYGLDSNVNNSSSEGDD